LFRIVPFTPFRIGGELGVSPLPGEFAVGQEFPPCAIVLTLPLFVRGVPFRIGAFFSEPFAEEAEAVRQSEERKKIEERETLLNWRRS